MISWIDTNNPTATLTYSPATATSGSVVVTLQANKILKATPTGWTSAGNNSYTKTYTGITTEQVLLTDTANNTGTVEVNIRRIDTTAPVATNVSYTPDAQTPTNGSVEVTLTVSESIQPPLGWSKLSDTSYAKVFSHNTGLTVTFYDLVGNE
jgi:hypothetical protein